MPAAAPAELSLLTPPGAGAVGVIRVAGREAVAVVDRVFRPVRGGPLGSTRPGRLRFGRIGGDAGEEVVAVILPGDPPVVEVQGHGGRAVLDFVRSELLLAGATDQRPTRPVRRSTAAEALDALPGAATLRVAEILLDQAHGALDQELARIARRLDQGNTAEALAAIDTLCEAAEVGLAMLDGWRVAIAGRPNVGKSRLLNALAGFDRAIVASSPGTTRDAIRIRVALDGWPVEIIDTAGIRESADEVERDGVRVARAVHAGADAIVLVLDRSEPRRAEDEALLRLHPTAIRVANKVDRPAAWEAAGLDALEVSAQEGRGLDGLIASVVTRLVPRPPTAGAPVPFTAAQVRRLGGVRSAIRRGNPGRAARLLTAWSAIGPPRPRP